jgi:RNase P subunit RPR2
LLYSALFIDEKFYKGKCLHNFEDGHNRLETPVPFPNTEVKLSMLAMLVPEKARSHQAVFFDFLYIFILLFLVYFMKKISKPEAQKQIKNFFEHAESKKPEEVKKIKKLAMGNNIQLKELRKNFCKRCCFLLGDSKVRIKNGIKSVECKNCGYVSRWKMK